MKPNETQGKKLTAEQYLTSKGITEADSRFAETVNLINGFASQFQSEESEAKKEVKCGFEEAIDKVIEDLENLINGDNSDNVLLGEDNGIKMGIRRLEDLRSRYRSLVPKEESKRVSVETLEDRLFKLANEFAIIGLGEVAVSLHTIHNDLPPAPSNSNEKGGDK